MPSLKKIEFIIEDLLSPYIKENFPLYLEMLKLFGKYVDENYIGKILHIEENLDPYEIYSELLDYFLDDIFSGNFDFDIIDLTDDNKKRFIDLAEKINSTKGNKQSFFIFFQSLSNFILATESGNVSIADLGSMSFYEPTADEDIFKYTLNVVTTNISGYEALIQSVHPAGMLYNIQGVLYDGTYSYDGTILYSGEIA